MVTFVNSSNFASDRLYKFSYLEIFIIIIVSSLLRNHLIATAIYSRKQETIIEAEKPSIKTLLLPFPCPYSELMWSQEMSVTLDN